MRRWKVAALVMGPALAVLGVRAAAVAERRVVAEVQEQAAAAGLSVGAVHFSWLGPIRLQAVATPGPRDTRLTADNVSVKWRVRGGADPRAHVAGLELRGVRARRGSLAFDLPAVDLEVLAWERAAGGERIRLRQRSGGTVEARWAPGHAELDLAAFDAAAAVVRWDGQPLVAPGRWSGRVLVAREQAGVRTTGDLSITGARFSVGVALGTADAAPGTPTDLTLTWSARREEGSVVVDRAAASAAALRVEVRGRFGVERARRRVEAEVEMEGELGGALRAAGLGLPAPLASRPAARLGTASFAVSVRGDLDDLASVRVAPRLRFDPAPDAADGLRFLSRPFRHAALADGRRIDVSAGAPDFVPLAEVPPEFVRMLLLAEDAGFFGHPGIDVAEIPVAWAENAERGGFARGASTITQQLARNLFLTREKSYARKVEEAVLALTLDASVPKSRILEIYLNVIEWGPDVHGLRPAARHYFGKHPAQLTTREMAFLVCLVPSPVRYHSAHRAGRPGPGMEQLIDNLLAKMHAAGALDAEEYDRAITELLTFAPEGGTATIG